jgi:HEXXH motif-containing protein
VAEVAPGVGRGAALDALRHARLAHTLCVFLKALREISASYPDAARDAGCQGAYEILAGLPIEAQHEIVSYPTFAIWLDQLLATTQAGGERLPEVLRHLWRFAISGAMKTQSGDFRCRVPVDRAGRIFFPATHQYVQIQECQSGHSVLASIRRGSVEIESESRTAPVWNSIPIFGPGIEINSLDSDFDAFTPTSFERDQLTKRHEIRWLAIAIPAWEMIAQVSEPLSKELSLHRVIVPIRVDKPQIALSATSPDVPATSFSSWCSTTPELVEMLIHEYHHDKLNMLLSVDPLITGSETAVYPSPWKEQPRPLLGILHGAYVFTGVFQFWSWVFEGNEASLGMLFRDRVLRHCVRLREQLAQAFQTLGRNAAFSALGAGLFETLQTIVERSDVRLSRFMVQKT